MENIWCVFKALANEDILLRTHCCGHIVTDTLLLVMFLWLRKLGNICCRSKMFLNKIRNIFWCPGYKICVRNKCCARGQTGKHLCRQQSCVHNSVSSFARPLDWLINLRSQIPPFFVLGRGITSCFGHFTGCFALVVCMKRKRFSAIITLAAEYTNVESLTRFSYCCRFRCYRCWNWKWIWKRLSVYRKTAQPLLLNKVYFYLHKAPCVTCFTNSMKYFLYGRLQLALCCWCLCRISWISLVLWRTVILSHVYAIECTCTVISRYNPSNIFVPARLV